MMTEVLRPYTAFDTGDLAERLNEAVRESVTELESRHMLGVIARYGHDLDLAKQKVEKGQLEHDGGVIQHYAIIGSVSREVEGAASIIPTLPLRKLYLPVPTGIAARIKPLRTDDPEFSPNIHAWTTTRHYKDLSAAYRDLVALAQEQKHGEAPARIWSIEPLDSDTEIHEAIGSAGLSSFKIARYDDFESRWSIPPRSLLYEAAATRL